MEYAAPYAAASASEFIRRVFNWMTGGLVLTGFIAYLLSSSGSAMDFFRDNPVLFFVLLIAQLGVVIGLVALMNRISAATASALFLLYAALVGVTFSILFEIYTSASIAVTFFVTAGMFGAMAVYGYTTKRDLTKLGSILFMALIGLIIASIVNIFWANSALYWIVTYAGVLIFSGLTAYDMQKIKTIGESAGSGEEQEKQAVFGALSLYLDFINLFIFLLRIFGQRR